MIFVTVGSMIAFDRLVLAMDNWAQAHPSEDIFAQIGAGTYEPRHMRWARMLSPSEFRDFVRQSSVIVAHAGMGSFFVAMEIGRPIVLFPRQASRHEATTDHQLHTVEWLREKPGVYVATTDCELTATVDKALAEGTLPRAGFHTIAPEPFLTRIRAFLAE